MSMKVVLADDEAPARKLLREYLSSMDELEIIAECRNGVEAVSIINVLRPDLIFLDVQMPGKTGFEVLPELEHLPKIIFSTAYDQYALQAFEVNAVDYLLKPYSKVRLEQAVQKIMGIQKQQSLQQLTDYLPQPLYPERILVELGNKLVTLAVTDIIWIEADGDYTRIHTITQSYLSNKGISELERRLHPQQFQRVHRSALIALSAIKEVYREPSGPQILLTNDVLVKVSRSYVEAIRKLMY